MNRKGGEGGEEGEGGEGEARILIVDALLLLRTTINDKRKDQIRVRFVFLLSLLFR